MPNRFAALLPCAAWLIAGAALAQPALAQPAAKDPAPVAPVTVQGTAPPAMVEEQARSFVKAYAAPTAKTGQFARWHGTVCVQVIGLAPALAAQVKARTEEVATELELKAAPAGCPANIQIVFSDAPQRLLDGMVAKGQYSIFGYHERYQTKAVTTMSRPIQAWYKTATQGEGLNGANAAFANFTQGGQLTFVTPTGMAQGMFPGMSQAGAQTTVDSPESGTPMGCANSHFSECLQSLFLNVLVVVDNAKVKGQPLGPVSDYVAMLALSQPRSLDGCQALPSVIDLFAKSPCEGRTAPDGLTAADAAYLTALYKADPQNKGRWEQDDIMAEMADILIKAQSAAGKPGASPTANR